MAVILNVELQSIAKTWVVRLSIILNRLINSINHALLTQTVLFHAKNARFYMVCRSEPVDTGVKGVLLCFPVSTASGYAGGVTTTSQRMPLMSITINKAPRRKNDMVKDNFLLPPQIRVPLRALANETGCTVSEHVRTALREYLAKHKVNCDEQEEIAA
jgi:hypothetical protein